jgi:hypothetical protein
LCASAVRALGWAAGAALLASGCVLIPTLRGPPPSVEAPREDVPGDKNLAAMPGSHPPAALADVRGIVHCH